MFFSRLVFISGVEVVAVV